MQEKGVNKMKIVETSLNLRIERGKRKENYLLSQNIAKKQLSVMDTDIYTNVEFMDCDNSDYLKTFADCGYNSFTSIDAKGRGILCEIKKEYAVKKIEEMTEPHMLHLLVEKGNEYIDLITVRLLVAGGDYADFRDRNRQWNKVLSYIENLSDKSHLVLTGDFNHGVISNDINGYRNRPRQYFNYQMVVKDLKNKNIILYQMEGYSYRGYMKIDHIATGEKILVENAVYDDIFSNTEIIGIPDHSCIIANIKCA